MKTCIELSSLPYPVKLEQSEDKRGLFTVTYGKQVRRGPTLPPLELVRTFNLIFEAANVQREMTLDFLRGGWVD